MSDDVLNPRLFNGLMRVFGSVRVSHRGFACSGDGWSGEVYRVNCPVCRETRFRLSVHHTFGLRDETGRQDFGRVHCFNSDCYTGNFERRQRLVDLMKMPPFMLARAAIRKGRELSQVDDEEITWPGPCDSIDEVPKRSKARIYLEETRGFDVDRLARCYDVRVCRDSYFTTLPGRIVIPVYVKDELKGWQGRWPEDLPWHDKSVKKNLPTKYFNTPGVQFGDLVYSLDAAQRYHTGVVVEGCTDVWKFGGPAVAVFKSKISAAQRRTLFDAFKSRSLVFMLDSETAVRESMKEFIDVYRGEYDGDVAVVWLPEGRDPGSYDRDFLRGYVEEEAKKQGVKVSWKKVAS